LRAGVIYAVLAFVLWGLFPLYWKALDAVPAAEILCHRMAWSLLFMAALLAIRRRWSWVIPALRNPRVLLVFFGTASILSVNWFTYIWAVNHGQIVGSSLGYFITRSARHRDGLSPRGGRVIWRSPCHVGVAYRRLPLFPWIASFAVVRPTA
jgi:RarD protein